MQTGSSFANLTGIDKIFTVQFFNGNLTHADRFSYVTYTTSEGGGDIPATINAGYQTVSTSSFDEVVELNETVASTFVEANIAWSDLGNVSASMPAVAVVEDFANSFTDAVNFTLHSEPIPTPRVFVDTQEAWLGMEIAISAQNFNPSGTAQLIFNDELDKLIAIDVNGEFQANMLVEDVGIGTYYLEVLDDLGNLAIMIIDVIEDPTSTTVDSTTSVSSTTMSVIDTTESSTASEQTDEQSSDDGININFIIIVLSLSMIVLHRRQSR